MRKGITFVAGVGTCHTVSGVWYDPIVTIIGIERNREEYRSFSSLPVQMLLALICAMQKII